LCHSTRSSGWCQINDGLLGGGGGGQVVVPKNLWVVAGNPAAGGNSLGYSTDAITWTGLTGTGIFGGGNIVAYSPNLWVAGGSGTNTLAYSIDAINWTGITGTTIFSTNVRGVAYGQNIWVAAGQGTNTLGYSANGFNWTGLGTSISAGYMNDVAYSTSQDLWVSCGNGGNKLAYSKNGFNWTGITGTTVFPGYGLSVAYSNSQGIWVSTGGYQVNTAAYSTNGVNWTGVGVNGITHEGWGVAYSEYLDLWIAGGYSSVSANNLAYSKNGINWTNNIAANLYANQGLRVSCSSNRNILTACINGGGNSIAYSTNGVNWTGLGTSSGISVGNGIATYVYPGVIPQPVQWFKCNSGDISGTTIYNYSTGVYDGSNNGGGTITTLIKTGNCTGSFIINPGYPLFPSFTPNATGCSFLVWTYVTGNGGFFASPQLSNSYSNLINIQLGSTTSTYIAAGSCVQSFPTPVYSLSTWNHWVLTLSPSGYYSYLNGSLFASYTTNTSSDYSSKINGITRANNTMGFTFQNHNFNGAAGNFCDYRVYNIALSTDQVNTLYSKGAGGI
jgi:hypothetical protein